MGEGWTYKYILQGSLISIPTKVEKQINKLRSNFCRDLIVRRTGCIWLDGQLWANNRGPVVKSLRLFNECLQVQMATEIETNKGEMWKGWSKFNMELMETDAIKQLHLMGVLVRRQIGNPWGEFGEVVGSKWIPAENYGKANNWKPALWKNTSQVCIILSSTKSIQRTIEEHFKEECRNLLGIINHQH